MARYQITGAVNIDYVLVMNMMRNRTESVTEVRRFDSKEELIAWYNAQLVPVYRDEGPSGDFGGPETQIYNKSFAKGSELEWFNPLRPEEFERPNHYGRGVHLSYSNLDIEAKTLIG